MVLKSFFSGFLRLYHELLSFFTFFPFCCGPHILTKYCLVVVRHEPEAVRHETELVARTETELVVRTESELAVRTETKLAVRPNTKLVVRPETKLAVRHETKLAVNT